MQKETSKVPKAGSKGESSVPVIVQDLIKEGLWFQMDFKKYYTTKMLHLKKFNWVPRRHEGPT